MYDFALSISCLIKTPKIYCCSCQLYMLNYRHMILSHFWLENINALKRTSGANKLKDSAKNIYVVLLASEENHLMFSVRQWRRKSCITWACVSYASTARLEPSSFLLSLNEVAWFTEPWYIRALFSPCSLILLYCIPCNIYVRQHVNFVTMFAL